MSKIYVICNKHDENLLSLYQEANFLGHVIVPFYHKKYDSSFHELYKIVTPDDYVMVLHASFGSDLLYDLIANINCKKFLNSISYQNNMIGNKLFQQSTVNKFDSTITIPTYTQQNISQLTTIPFIAKPSGGSCGSGVLLLRDKSTITNVPSGYVFQRYIKNDGDWRVVVVGGKSVSAIKRLGKIGQATNNIATGNFAIKETNPNVLDKIYSLAESVAKYLHFDYVGIDVIQDKETDKYYFLESNERATFETSQILTGTNIAQEIIKELTK